MILVGTNGSSVVLRIEEDGKEDPLRFTLTMTTLAAVQLSQQLKLLSAHAQETIDSAQTQHSPIENNG